MSILLVVARPAEAMFLQRFIETEGLAVERLSDTVRAEERALSGSFTMIILDASPEETGGIRGMEILRRIRQRSLLPVLMLSSKEDDSARILTLEAGADDYLQKPYLPEELLARVRAILRRAGAGVSDFRHLLKAGDIELDRLRRKVRKSGEDIVLTSAEFDLLDLLLRRAGQPVPRQEIAGLILGRPLNHNDRSIDMHISNLRRKFRGNGKDVVRIEAIRGVGYSFTI